jgi:hypothetical protein
MAEFRRVGGEMEPYRGPSSRRVLLPSEIELCDAVGITEDEYFHFVDLASVYNGKRPKEYDLIPDIRNEPVSIAVAVIGVALQAVAALLAPKPRAPEERRSLGPLRTADITGQSRFAPQSEFNSVQNIAELGSVIPLIFTQRGVRVNAQLLWSQFRAKGLTQQLNAIFLFGAGPVEQKPDYQGFAIGDSALRVYTGSKINLIFNGNGGRITKKPDQYPEANLQPAAGNNDVFSIVWDIDNTVQPVFCQARFPATQRQFGAFAPMPNGQKFQVNYELVLIPNLQNPDKSGPGPAKIQARIKSRKINFEFPRRCAVTRVDNDGFTYRIGNNSESDNPTRTEDQKVTDEQFTGTFEPWGVSDVDQSTESTRSNADSSIDIGELYLGGTRLAVCVNADTNEPWSPGIVKQYTFEWTEGGGSNNLDVTASLDTRKADEVRIIQRAAVATVTTSRPCDAIEIGIKSTVFKRINGFANVNSQPDNDTLGQYEDNGGGLSLGSINKYAKRYSFFKLQRRRANQGDGEIFKDLFPGRVFAVEGNTPQAQYTSIRIYHPNDTNWEYRLLPFPGNAFKQNQLNRGNATFDPNVFLLFEGNKQVFERDGVTIAFTGRATVLRTADVRNKEFFIRGDVNRNLLENDAIADFVVYDQEELSNFTAPEHEVSFVNEYTLNNETPRYDNLAIAGLRIGASSEWSNFDQFSAFFKTGVSTERLIRSGRGPVNTLPEIAYALLTDDSLGAGSSIGADQVDRTRMVRSARFCERNGFFWDGVISDRQNIREFIFENAAYCLLDFTIIGGRFSLFPSIPNKAITLNASAKNLLEPDISALFTDGNIRNLQVSFLSPEERQLFKAVVLWRENKENGFPVTRTVEIRFNPAGVSSAEGKVAPSDKDPEEVFDLSGFCTSEDHAIKFAKFALKTRREVDHGITFETTPSGAAGLNPGDYFRLVSQATHVSRFSNGSITGNGEIQAVDLPDGNVSIFYWKPSFTEVRSATIPVTNNKTNDSSVFGSVFTVNNQTTTDRVYKVESISYAEDGLVEIAGSNAPLTDDGFLEVVNWDDSQFIKVEY